MLFVYLRSVGLQKVYGENLSIRWKANIIGNTRVRKKQVNSNLEARLH